MARLSRDDSSWHAHGLKKRYADFDPDQTPKAKNKKNTKRWCRGVEGREHVIRDVVIGLSTHGKTVRGCTQNPDFRGTECCHHRSVTKCINCEAKVGWGWGRKGPNKTHKKVDGVVTEQQLLAEKWCTEGHLWDWTTFHNNKPERYGWDSSAFYYSSGREFVVIKGQIMIKGKNYYGEVIYTKPQRMPRVHKYCVMCGLERKSQSREITPEDL